ncbi:MAG: disulfide bond formation protein B [Gammaproteobacteria bacterium]|nr:disulfide bond formation protein B [Gammaproteobacteria bacterium]
MNISARAMNFAAAGVCAGLLAAAYYFQYSLHLEPCPLCIFQRVGFFVVGLCFLLLGLHNPKAWGVRVYGFLALLAAVLGAAVAGRHVWLLSLPKEEVPSCGPGLNYLLDNFPLGEVLNTVLRGSGECAELKWSLMGLSMPAWCLVFFAGLGVLALWRVVKGGR